MQDDQIREALNRHWQASAAEDFDTEHSIYADDSICDYPQSGERILGPKNLEALRSHHPGKPSGFKVRRMVGVANLWVTEYTIDTRAGPHSPSASWSSTTAAKSCTRRNTSPIPLERPRGEASGFSS